MPNASLSRGPVGLAWVLVVTGLVGLTAAFALTLDKFISLEDPSAVLSCNLSPLVQCGTNLSSAQGAVFGFPNPLIGIIGFTAVVVVGMGVLAGARFARWFWVAFNLGILGAIVFVVWLITQSIFELNTLCPWCMVVWAATIPLFLAVTLHNVRSGALGVRGRVRTAIGGAYGWIPFITLICYIAIAVLAQVRLDVLGSF